MKRALIPFFLLWSVMILGLAAPLAAQTATPTPLPTATPLPIGTDVTLNINRAATSTRWAVTGEPSLVINGADITPLGVRPPFTVRSISITITQSVANAPVTAVVYQDANGGSPADAALVGRKVVNINSPGVFTATFDSPLTITQPVIWFGFYMPTGFEFEADTSGASVLTYWAWTPGTTFDVAQLSTARVLGPSNGTNPVGINMNGIARITAVLNTTQTVATATPGATPVSMGAIPLPNQVAQYALPSIGSYSANMQQYPRCPELAFDMADLFFTNGGDVRILCSYAPNPDLPAAPAGYIRRANSFDLTPQRIANSTVVVEGFLNPVTHCVQPQSDDLTRAVIGFTESNQRSWRFLPSVRTGNFVCAEVPGGGYLAYFIPAS